MAKYFVELVLRILYDEIFHRWISTENIGRRNISLVALHEEYYDSIDTPDIMDIVSRSISSMASYQYGNIGTAEYLHHDIIHEISFICNVTLLILHRGISRQWHRIVNICIVVLHGRYCTAEYFINGFAQKILHCGIFERSYVQLLSNILSVVLHEEYCTAD